jgi:tetratricopeptide (TPR) repeat protein
VKLIGLWVAAGLLSLVLRESNSHAASARGAKQYAEKNYGEAVKSFGTAQETAPSPRNAFNLGTAQIASGDREGGSKTIDGALDDPALRADALYNRGNSALGAKALDHAIRDYAAALRLNPKHAAAKRNLEIAQRQKQNQQRTGSGQQPNQQGQNQQQQQQQPSRGQQQQQQAPQQGQADAEALLRSVQQQEQEELARMKAQRPAGRVGW